VALSSTWLGQCKTQVYQGVSLLNIAHKKYYIQYGRFMRMSSNQDDLISISNLCYCYFQCLIKNTIKTSSENILQYSTTMVEYANAMTFFE
jgi:hypothetical protein